MSVHRHNLTDQSRADPAVIPPYKWDEISETAKHNQILSIVAGAQPQTRPYYQVGRYMTKVAEENWVARWYLWHAFRYRCVASNRLQMSVLIVFDRDNRVPKSRPAAANAGTAPHSWDWLHAGSHICTAEALMTNDRCANILHCWWLLRPGSWSLPLDPPRTGLLDLRGSAGCSERRPGEKPDGIVFCRC